MVVADVDHPELADDDLRHLTRSLRLRSGAALVVADGAGRWRPARLTAAAVEATGEVVTAERPAPTLTVAFALTKASKPELATQKLTELGVDRILPFVAARSVVRWDPAKAAAAHARLVRVSREAAQQSRRAWLPTVAPVADFAAVAAEPGAARADRGGAPLTVATPTVLVGPEGGWAAEETATDLPVVALGDGVLRAETAAIVAGALLAALRAGVVAGA